MRGARQEVRRRSQQGGVVELVEYFREPGRRGAPIIPSRNEHACRRWLQVHNYEQSHTSKGRGYTCWTISSEALIVLSTEEEMEEDSVPVHEHWFSERCDLPVPAVHRWFLLCCP